MSHVQECMIPHASNRCCCPSSTPTPSQLWKFALQNSTKDTSVLFAFVHFWTFFFLAEFIRKRSKESDLFQTFITLQTRRPLQLIKICRFRLFSPGRKRALCVINVYKFLQSKLPSMATLWYELSHFEKALLCSIQFHYVRDNVVSLYSSHKTNCRGDRSYAQLNFPLLPINFPWKPHLNPICIQPWENF